MSEPPPPPQIPNLMDAGPEDVPRMTIVTQDAVNTLSRVLGREHEGLQRIASETGDRIEEASSKASQTTASPRKEKTKEGLPTIPERPSAPPWEGRTMEKAPAMPVRMETQPDRGDVPDRTRRRSSTTGSETPSSSGHSRYEKTEAMLQELTASVGQLQLQMQGLNAPERRGPVEHVERVDRQRSRVKVARPPVYTGQVGKAGLDPLEDWIYALEMYFRALEITDPHLIAEYACSMLREKAAAWSRTSQRKRLERGEVQWDWTRLISELRRQFGRLNPAKDSRIQLEKLKQRDNTVRSLREYTNQFMSLAVGLADASEAELLHRFTGGLQPEPCYELIRANVDTVEEAIRTMENYAMALDATHMQVGGRNFRSTRGSAGAVGHRSGNTRNKSQQEPWRAYQFQAERGRRIQFPITVKSMGHFLALVEKGLERNWLREKVKTKITELEENSAPVHPRSSPAAAKETLLNEAQEWDEEGDWVELPADGNNMSEGDLKAAQTGWDIHSFQSSEEDEEDLGDLLMVEVDDEVEVGLKAGNGRNLLMTIKCSIGSGVEAEVLLDTGASVNIMGRVLFQKLEKKGAVLQTKEKKTLRGIGGITVGVEGSTVLPITIGKMSVVLLFLVVTQEPHLILGKTGMSRLHMMLDPATDTIIHKDTWEILACGGTPDKAVKQKEERALPGKNLEKTWQVKLNPGAFPPMQKEVGKYEVRLSQDIWLPPSKTVHVRTGVFYRFPLGMVGRIEGKSSLVSQRLTLQAGNMPQQGEVRFMLCNLGKQVCRLHRGQRCAIVVIQRGLTPPLVVHRIGKDADEGPSGSMMVKTLQVVPESMSVLHSTESKEITMSLMQPVDKKFWPRQEPQGVIIPLGKSLVLGLGEARKVLMPYRVNTPPQEIKDCLNLKVRAWTKWLPNGTLMLLLHNQADEPIQLTPSMRVLWLPGVKLQLRGLEGECLHQENRVPHQVMEVEQSALVTVAEMEEEFPSCFNNDFKLIERMKKVTIGTSDVLWKNKRIWHSSAYYQPISAIQETIVAKELKDLASKGIIEEVPVETKLFLSQLLVIPKGTGACRITLDLRRLNSMCIPWSSPLPGRRSLLSKVPKDWKYLSKIDLAHGFYNIPISSQLSRMFSFVFQNKKYVLKRLAMGWLNSPSMFHSLVSGALADLPVIVYLDDLLVGGQDIQTHNLAVRKVMERLQVWGFKVKASKMEIGRKQVEFLGYLVKSGCFTVRPAVFQTLQQLPVISSLTTLRQGLGVLNLLQEVIPSYSQEVGPLYEGLKKKGQIKDWSKIQDSFKNIVQRCLSRVFYLNAVDPHSDQFHLFCDWSGTAIGFVLWQIDSQGKRRLLQFGSRQNPVWRRATSSLLGELFALVWSLKSTSWITKGSQRIVVFTDSQNIVVKLRNLKQLVKEPDIRCLRLIGFLLSNYSLGQGLQLKFIATAQNQLADLLSRWSYTEKRENYPWSPTTLEQEENLMGRTTEIVPLSSVQPGHEVGLNMSVSDQNWAVLHGGHFGLATVMYRSKKLGIPISVKAATDKLAKCRICQAFRSIRRDTKLGTLVTVSKPWQGLALDYIGPVDHRYILVVKDLFSKELLLRVTSTCSYGEGVTALEAWKSGQPGRSYPKVLQLDKAGGFNAHSFRTWTDRHQIRVVYAHAYDHRSHGAVERANQVVIKTVGKIVLESGRVWWECVRAAQNWINYSYNRSIGMAPHDCSNGDIAVWRQASTRLEQMRREMNSGRRDLPFQYSAGDAVWVYKLALRRRGKLAKFAPLWDGPLVVVDRQSASSYRVRNRSGRVFQIHADFVRPYPQ